MTPSSLINKKDFLYTRCNGYTAVARYLVPRLCKQIGIK
jgi:hypothetical protein